MLNKKEKMLYAKGIEKGKQECCSPKPSPKQSGGNKKQNKRWFTIDYFDKELGFMGKMTKRVKASSPEEAVYLTFSKYVGYGNCFLYSVRDENTSYFNIKINDVMRKGI